MGGSIPIEIDCRDGNLENRGVVLMGQKQHLGLKSIAVGGKHLQLPAEFRRDSAQTGLSVREILAMDSMEDPAGGGVACPTCPGRTGVKCPGTEDEGGWIGAEGSDDAFDVCGQVLAVSIGGDDGGYWAEMLLDPGESGLERGTFSFVGGVVKDGDTLGGLDGFKGGIEFAATSVVDDHDINGRSGSKGIDELRECTSSAEGRDEKDGRAGDGGRRR